MKTPLLQFRQSRWKHFGLLLLALILIGVSCFCAIAGRDPVRRTIGWCGVAFFALGIIPFVHGLVTGRVTVVMDVAGITDQRLGIGLVPWNNITECSVASVYGTSLLCLKLTDPDLFLAQLPTANRTLTRANQALGFGDLTLSFVGLSPSIEEAVAFIRAQGITVGE